MIDNHSLQSYNAYIKEVFTMKLIKKFTLSEGTRRFVTYSIYIIFTIFTLTKLIQEPSFVGRICYGLILGVFMGITLWAEYLKYLYQKMIVSLTMECDPDKSSLYYQLLVKKDIFKNYRNPLYIFNTLYFQDIDKPQDCIDLLQSQDKMFRSSLDYLLIRNYTYFYSYYRLGNRTKVKKYYPEVMRLKGAKIKGSKVNPLYNWEFIEAIYLLSNKEFKKALSAFKNINTKNFNNRELSQYYTEFGKLYLELKDPENAVIMFEKSLEVGRKLAYGKEAEVILQNLLK